MALTSFSSSNTIAWTLSNSTNTAYSAITQGDNVQFTGNGVDTTTFNQLFTAYYTILAAGTQVIDLFSFTNIVNEAVAFTKVYELFILVDTGSGGNILVQPGASNALQWFFNGSTQGINLPNGTGVCYMLPISGTGQTVDATHRNILLTNSGGSTVGVKITVMGKA